MALPVNRSVLVVDDEPNIRQFVNDSLTQESFDVVEADNGEDALQVLTGTSVDLVILDIMMPKMDGFEVCRRIREQSRVPIIMLSAVADPSDKAKCLDIGADDYMVKPFGINELLARIKAVLQRSHIGK